MKYILKNHLYIIGLALTISFAVALNWQIPPNLDEARAYMIARYLSPIEIFSISKTEGHPFLWFFILMPITKLHTFYPIPLYAINLIFIIIALYILYSNKSIPTYIKYFITLSTPFLKFYNSFARCYSLTIMLSFIILKIREQRFSKPFTYLFLIILLANSSAMGFFIASSLWALFLYENFVKIKSTQNTTTTYLIIFCGVVELFLLFLQFYGYNTQIPIVTPKFKTLKDGLNIAYSPINVYMLIILYIASFCIFIKQKKYQSFFFLLFTSTQLTILINFIHRGGSQHYYFYYINLIYAYLIAQKLKHLHFIPLAILSFALIFNTNMHYKKHDISYLTDLKISALEINKLYPTQPQEIFAFEDIQSNIFEPYLKSNITLLNQTGKSLKTLKGLEEFLYYLYIPIKAKDIERIAQKNPHTLLYKACGEDVYYNSNLKFNLKHRLNQQYCLYSISINN